ncbi:AsmA family protein [Deminuibacter soli]|uniref:DUF748 domain-containing protein n=1 Tax=Deminuibacter soli TaxID=2291815 RepID=A0A3E1NQG4_9BACT|nr:hypothetical protein [Deminuibacter soli]RFM30163.1 hypothetical protein DXN05_04100 [Deminuibacter soli]
MKKLLIVSAIVLVAGAAGVLAYLHFTRNKDLTPLVTKKLQQLVHDGSGGLYNLKVDSIELDVIAGNILLYNASLQADSSVLQQMKQTNRAPENVFRVSVKLLDLKGLSPKTLLDKKNIDLSTLHIREPKVEIFHQTASEAKSPDSLYHKIGKELHSFKLGDLLLDKIAFTYYDLDKGGKTTHLDNLSCHFTNILVDSTTQHDTTRFLFAKEAVLLLSNYEHISKSGLYRFAIDSMTMVATSRQIHIRNLTLRPAGKKEDFSSKIKLRQDRYDLHISNISASNVDWFNLLINKTMIADEVNISNGSWEIFSDQRVPPSNESKLGSFPHQKLTQLLMPVYIKNIRIHDLDIIYQEFNPLSGQKGTVEFYHADGVISNVTNAVDKIKANQYMEIKAHAAFMQQARIDATIRFDLKNAAAGLFTVDGKVGNMDVTHLNKATIPLGLFDVKSGTLKQFTFHMEGNNRRSAATTSVTYSDLKVNAMAKDEDHPGEVKKKGLATFIANNFMLAKSSPDKGSSPIEQHVTFTKTPQQTFWGFIWKTVMEGIRPSIKGQKEKKKDA